MVHVTDMFTTLLRFAGCEAPRDRLIDGVDQSAFFLGKQETSNREACMVWLKDELHAVKWKDFKINFKRQQHFPRPGTAARLCPHHAPPGGPERTRSRQPAIRALVGDAARASNRPGLRREHQEGTAHPAGIAARLRAEDRSIRLGSCPRTRQARTPLPSRTMERTSCRSVSAARKRAAQLTRHVGDT